MGDDQRGRLRQHVAQRRLDQRLGVHVEGRQRVVEHQHRRPAEDGAGQRQPLPLAAGQRQALLADARGQAPREVVDELRLRHPQRLGHVGVGGVGPAEGEVLADAHREQRRVLEGGGDDAAQLGQRQVAHVDAVQGDPAGGDVVEPPDQRGERRLARSGGADERDGLAGLDVEVDAVEHRRRRARIVEADALEPQPGGEPTAAGGAPGRSATVIGASSSSPIRSQALAVSCANANRKPSDRIGHSRTVNSATKPTSPPTVRAPVFTASAPPTRITPA